MLWQSVGCVCQWLRFAMFLSMYTCSSLSLSIYIYIYMSVALLAWGAGAPATKVYSDALLWKTWGAD